jgi:hypothetical protein
MKIKEASRTQENDAVTVVTEYYNDNNQLLFRSVSVSYGNPLMVASDAELSTAS